MSLAYAALAGVVVIIAVMWLALRTSSSAARSAGRADAEAMAAKTVAKNARAANEVRGSVAGADDAAARDRLRRWQRE